MLSGSAPRGVGADLLFGAFGTPSRPKNLSLSPSPNLIRTSRTLDRALTLP